ncbi:hypothetical protein GE061_014146 [Apolygus lucorum]|uniref:Uncharacterized protein n=1 Tax=Apolygus lucorum TaxID=248454 RepID=A0A8S9XQ12_APOLU|nr:hypothetical protein GE061_014146 [Apolygus lucorum]
MRVIMTFLRDRTYPQIPITNLVLVSSDDSDDSILPPSVHESHQYQRSYQDVSFAAAGPSTLVQNAADTLPPTSQPNVSQEAESFIGNGDDQLPSMKKRKLGKKLISKQKKLRGEGYVGHRGIEKPPRPMLPSPCVANRNHSCTQQG